MIIVEIYVKNAADIVKDVVSDKTVSCVHVCECEMTESWAVTINLSSEYEVRLTVIRRVSWGEENTEHRHYPSSHNSVKLELISRKQSSHVMLVDVVGQVWPQKC